MLFRSAKIFLRHRSKKTKSVPPFSTHAGPGYQNIEKVMVYEEQANLPFDSLRHWSCTRPGSRKNLARLNPFSCFDLSLTKKKKLLATPLEPTL